jgi:hypothetical protein
VAARVLQFGWDDCYRGQVLKYAGYSVIRAENLYSLTRDLQIGPNFDAVVMSEEDSRTTEKAAEVVRRHSKAPVILFRRLSVDIDESKFDQVFKGFVAPEAWLARTAELIAQSKDARDRSAELRQNSELLRQETQAVCRETRRLRLRLGIELARNKPPRP